MGRNTASACLNPPEWPASAENEKKKRARLIPKRLQLQGPPGPTTPTSTLAWGRSSMFSMACPPAHPQQYCSTREKQNQRPRELGGQRLWRPRSMTRPRSKAGVAGPHGPLTGAQEALGRHVSDSPIAGVMTQAPGECAPLPARPRPLPPKLGLTSAHTPT